MVVVGVQLSSVGSFLRGAPSRRSFCSRAPFAFGVRRIACEQVGIVFFRLWGMPALSHASLLGFGALSHHLVRFFFVACLPVVAGVCPHCFGNLAGCDFDNDATSCPYVKTTTANVAALGAAAAGTTLLTLSGVLAPRFLKAFTSATLSAILRLARRKPVTAYEVKATSKIDEIMTAVSTGAISYEDALVALGGLADSEADATRAAALWRRYEMLSKAKEVGKLALTTTAMEDTGVYSWLWAKTSEHIATRAIDTTVSVEVGSGVGSSSSADT